MCGICGFYGFEDKELIKAMNDKLHHRGPDQEGYYSNKNIMLGHRRLNIIDLSETGRQPCHNENDTIHLVYNGEIYNFQEIKEDLESKGHVFYSKTDTEVIVHAYEEYGPECLQKFNGMFAFALWDDDKKLLFLARDRFGVKPLHYYKDKDKFIFASEIKAILEADIPRKVNKTALTQFLAFEYVPAPLTMFENINKLPAGHYAILKDNNLTIKQWYDVKVEEKDWDEQKLIKETKNLLKESVKLRLMSDVPLGSFLSGGIDSSTVVGMMSQLTDDPIKTFSIGFTEKSYDESAEARLVANKFNTDHTEKIVDPQDIIPLFKKLIPDIDEPFGDLSIFPTYLVSQLARQKVIVSLSGDGADEIFGGYDWYRAQDLSNTYKMIPGKKLFHPLIHNLPQTKKSKGLVNKAKRFAEGTEKLDKYEHLRFMTNIKIDDMKDALTYPMIHDPYKPMLNLNKGQSLNKNMYIDIKTYLTDDILTKLDRSSMMVSLEAREPLLDYNLVEHAMSIPSNLKLSGSTRKYILKKAVQDLLPKPILKKGKQGFTIPMKHWMRNELKDYVQEKLSEENLKEMGYFKPEYVNKVLNTHFSKKRDMQRHIWAMLSFTLWHENYIS